ncbi:MAG: thioredoxin domain-containing protein [Candidatus Micrarchaeota archaeon]
MEGLSDSGKNDGAYIIAASILVCAVIFSAVALSTAGNLNVALQSLSSQLAGIKSAIASVAIPSAVPSAPPDATATPQPGLAGKIGGVTMQGRPVQGNSTKVAIVEFSDFQCPFCESFYTQSLPAIKPYVESGKARLVFKQFPLDIACNNLMTQQLHPNACRAATASLCAFDEGKFWPMHDKLFENQQALSQADLEKYAAAIGLDAAKFSSCLNQSNAYANQSNSSAVIAQDIAEGAQLGISGTPGFLIYTSSSPTPELLAKIAASAGGLASEIELLEGPDGNLVVRIVGALPGEAFTAVLDNL